MPSYIHGLSYLCFLSQRLRSGAGEVNTECDGQRGQAPVVFFPDHIDPHSTFLSAEEGKTFLYQRFYVCFFYIYICVYKHTHTFLKSVLIQFIFYTYIIIPNIYF